MNGFCLVLVVIVIVMRWIVLVSGSGGMRCGGVSWRFGGGVSRRRSCGVCGSRRRRRRSGGVSGLSVGRLSGVVVVVVGRSLGRMMSLLRSEDGRVGVGVFCFFLILSLRLSWRERLRN